MLDSHTHSHYSMDSVTPTRDMVEKAVELGLDYIAITDHYNADYLDIGEAYRDHSKELAYPLDIAGHIRDVRTLQEEYRDRIYVAVGIECGYSRASESVYVDNVARSDFDMIVNSVHVIDRGDIYDEILYNGTRSREYIFRRYLELVRESVDARYDYDTIGHIGYIARKAPYRDNLITMEEFGEEIDDILRAIIARGKCLECNAKSKNTPYVFLPGTDILARYYELGGRRITFGSDAHNTTRIAEKFDEIAGIARDIGFDGFTYFVNGEARLQKWQKG